MLKTEASGSHAKMAVSAAVRMRRLLTQQLWIWPLLTAALLVFVGVWIRAHMERALKRQIAASLTTIRDANVEALRAWAATMKSQAQLLAEGAQVRGLIESLVTRAAQQGTSPAVLAAAPEYATLQSCLKPVEEGHGFAGYAVLDTNLVVIAAGQTRFLGGTAPPEYAEQLSTCLTGTATVTPPFAVMGPVAGENGALQATMPLMYAAAPVRAANGRIIAVLGLRILPERDFTRILATTRSGVSGETYAFNREGVLLSESRFDEDLKHLGLIPDAASAHSLLTLDLRDPLVDLNRGRRPPRHRAELPFTKAVTEAIAGRDGVEVGGYRDYRGVTVVGAWTWLLDFGMGLVTECDLGEAVAPGMAVREGFWFLFGLLAVGSAIVYVLMRVARQAAFNAAQLGQYTLDDEIGSGAYGTVFRAHHALMRRPVAVKVLAPGAKGLAVARFEREVQMTCQLTHPNTIALYDYGRTEDDLFYYAMEFLDGLSLDRLIKQYGAQPEGRVICILRQVCGSLAEAHARGLVHRDVKPQNIFLTRRGGIADFVKVLDFGLVKARDAEGQLELTGADATLGTPLYMSPEAVEHGEEVDARSDIYSLGAVGYELLTGETVFTGTSISEVLLQQIRAQPEKPSVRLKRPVSPDLEDLLMQCLAKKPADRPASASALEEALGRCSASGTWTRQAAEQWWADHLATVAAKTIPTPSPAPAKPSWSGLFK